MTHRLDPLLRPKSVAIVGASERPDSMGEWSLRNLRRGGFTGDIYPVNPAYKLIDGLTCYDSVGALPRTPDLVIFALADRRIEQALDEALDAHIPAAVLMSSLFIDDDVEPNLRERVAAKIRDREMLVCGANGMGFYNVRDNVWACGFDSCMHEGPGNASLISHSGSGMSGIIDCEQRLQINFAISTGNELSVSMDEYLDFVLDLPETRVVGLFIETARNPQGFRDALAKARRKKIPLVALKVGRTAKSAELTVSHSGAMAGDDDTYDALFHRYGVHRVVDMDELATAMITFATMNPVGPGGLVTLHDSGGERQLLIDLADSTDVPLTELSADSVGALRKVLDAESPAVNPLDAWSRGGAGASQQMADSLSIMMNDHGAALGALIHDRAPDGVIYPSYVEHMKTAHEASGKPVALVASRQGSGSDPLVVSTTHDGFPVLDGVTAFLNSVRGLMNFRDYLQTEPASTVPVAMEIRNSWNDRLTSAEPIDEVTALAMLDDFGIDVSKSILANNESELFLAADSIGYPLVLKTAMPGALHKTELNGVRLNIENADELIAAYRDFNGRLGPRVLVAAMVPAGIEIMLGVKRDKQFGPVVMFGFGGILAEAQKDLVFAMPPFDAAYARRRLDELRMRPVLDGLRGRPAANLEAICNAAAAFSVMVDTLSDVIHEIDVNPMIASEQKCVAVDALVIARTT